MSVDDGLRRIIREKLRDLGHWLSVETGTTDQGVPDLNVCAIPSSPSSWKPDSRGLPWYLGAEIWIECKATKNWTVPLRPEQVGWLTTRARHGGRVFVAVRRRNEGGPRRGDPVDDLWLLRGEHAREIKTRGLQGIALDLPSAVVGTWRGGPSAWNWDEIRRGLLT